MLFRGKYSFLSNMHPAPVILDDMTFPNVENAYQAAKCADKSYMASFISMTAVEAKHAGRRVVVRSDWDTVKASIMDNLLRQKFAHSSLKQKLIDLSDDEIVEDNYWGDTYWGRCNGKGENVLGQLLMNIREECRAATVL